MGYGQWIDVHTTNNLPSETIEVRWAKNFSGKYYKNGQMDQETGARDVDQTRIPPHGTADIYACGRENAMQGTEGQFDLWDQGERICVVYWDCPYVGDNKFEIRERNSKYHVQEGNWNHGSSGALGQVDVKIDRD